MAKWWNIFHKGRRGESIASLHAKIERFQSLLEQNNFVLEQMAKASESLGGDLLFDFQYLRQLAEQLGDSVQNVILDLNLITDNRYPSLMEIFERIQVGVTEALESRPLVPHTPYVLSLHGIDRDLSSAVGGKIAHLCEIRERLKCHVPDGFVITSRACMRIFEQIRLTDRLQEIVAAREDEISYARGIEDRIGRLILATDIPRDISRSIRKALARISRGVKEMDLFALRSSSFGEDGELSFAGLHETFLGVPRADVLDTYKQVLASLFSAPAVAYRRGHGEPLESTLMAVGCMRMVPARSGGVVYTLDPNNPERDVLIVSAAVGLGNMVVEGGESIDQFVISRTPPYPVLSMKVRRKDGMYETDPQGGIRLIPVPQDRRDIPAVPEGFLAELADMALRIERYMKLAQDVEWAQDVNGELVILQSRSLRLQTDATGISRQAREAAIRHKVLLSDQGTIACRGIGYGRVVVVKGEEMPSDLPKDSVLVAHFPSPQLAELVPLANAVVTDVGASTGHLATITREFRVPTLMDVGSATSVLREGMEITVDAEENIVYEGKVDELLHYQALQRSSFEDTREFRILRRMLKHISPLNLKNPQAKNFTPRSCETYHDIIRFAHEKAVEYFLEGRDIGAMRRDPNCRKVVMRVPLDLKVIDIGGGLAADGETSKCSTEQICCAPLSVLLEGLNAPGAWSIEPTDMDFGSFMSGAMRPSVLSASQEGTRGGNLAIISDCYLNLNLHLGYHFSQVDSYISAARNDNYIYFRFAGGVTDINRRSRRAKMISIILEKQDFMVEAREDLVIGRMKKFDRETMLQRMRMLGLLIGFTRQMDVRMRGDSMIAVGVDEFMTALHTNHAKNDQEESMDKEIETLVIDDEAIVCDRMREFLTSKGIHVEAFTESEEAIARMKEKTFDVVITDLKMDGPTGIDVLRFIRDTQPATLGILITAYGQFESFREAEVLDAFEVVNKPFQLSAIHKLILKAAKRAKKGAKEQRARNQ